MSNGPPERCEPYGPEGPEGSHGTSRPISKAESDLRTRLEEAERQLAEWEDLVQCPACEGWYHKSQVHPTPDTEQMVCDDCCRIDDLRKQLATAREDTLEEAAKVCDEEAKRCEHLSQTHPKKHMRSEWIRARAVAYGLREAIRALSTQPAPQSEMCETSTPMTFRQLQDEQRPWVAHNFPGREAVYPLLGAVEELGELSHAHLKGMQGIRGTPEEHHAAKVDAVADTIIFLSDYCEASGIDLQDAIETTWAEVKMRDWKADPMNGKPKPQPTCGGSGELHQNGHGELFCLQLFDAGLKVVPCPGCPDCEPPCKTCGGCAVVYRKGVMGVEDPCPDCQKGGE